jgi:hypothetical protein
VTRSAALSARAALARAGRGTVALVVAVLLVSVGITGTAVAAATPTTSHEATALVGSPVTPQHPAPRPHTKHKKKKKKKHKHTKVHPRPAPTTVPDRPWFGVLQAQPQDYATFAHAGVRRMTLELGWDAYEPTAGTVDTAYVHVEQAKVAALDALGIQVVLDPGFQYPPSWVFALPGQPRFVDQYGDVWHGPTGSDAANGVFDPAVRAAEAAYIQQIRADFGARAFTAIRIGGLLSGELRYPDGHVDGRTDALWDYDSTAQAAAPVRGWRPGAGGTTAQATASLGYYDASITGYESFLLNRFAVAFPAAQLQVLFPGWGIRPGQTAAAIAGGLSGTTPAEQGDSIAAGLDYAQQVAALSRYGARGVGYCTWVDAPSGGNSTAYEPPVVYLAALAKQFGVGIAGENTGDDTPAALQLTVSRMLQLRLQGVMWMSAPQLLSGSGVTVADLANAIAATR